MCEAFARFFSWKITKVTKITHHRITLNPQHAVGVGCDNVMCDFCDASFRVCALSLYIWKYIYIL